MPEEPLLTLIRVDKKSSIECRLACCHLPSFAKETCLVVSFTGTIDNTNPYAGGYSYMHAMIGAGFTACNPATLILDLRGLEYDADEYMSKILDQRIVTKVVVSDQNRQSLTRLISSVLFLSPSAELFESPAEALIACDSAYREFLKDGRKRIIAADF